MDICYVYLITYYKVSIKLYMFMCMCFFFDVILCFFIMFIIIRNIEVYVIYHVIMCEYSNLLFIVKLMYWCVQYFMHNILIYHYLL